MIKTMKAATINRYGQQQIALAQMPIPTVGAEDVLVEIHAASINPIDFKTRDGKVKMLLHYKMPLILGSDFAGIITAVGAKVTQFKVGDAVYGRPRKSRIGTFADYIAVHHEDIALKPSNLSFEEAAAIPLVGLTSYQALHDMMHIQPNDKVLIQAGAGGIGTIAIQLAKLLGAYVATTTSAKNTDFVTQLGADEVIDYRTTNFEDVLHDYDFVYDTLGGEALEKAFTIVKPGGKIVSLSGLPNARFAKNHGLNPIKTLILRLATRNLTQLEKRYHVQYDFLFMKPSGEQLAYLASLIEQHKLVPIIDRVVPFDDIQQALDYSEAGRAKGKIIVSMKQ